MRQVFRRGAAYRGVQGVFWQKFAGIHFPAIHDEIFGSLPIIFCVVNEQERLPKNLHHAAGVEENIDAEVCLRMAMRRQPAGRNKILVVSGHSTKGMPIQVQQVVSKFQCELSFTFQSFSAPELSSRMSAQIRALIYINSDFLLGQDIVRVRQERHFRFMSRAHEE